MRPPAVAGLFYPDDRASLAREVEGFLDAPREPVLRPGFPKAILVPHAGYAYSGPIAGSAYALLRPARGIVRRMVVLGPCHRVAVRGLALPGVTAFDTPLGRVPIDLEAVARLADLPQVIVHRETHAREHSIEVQLPFLQALLGEFTLVPLVVGQASAAEVAEVMDRLWGGPETLFVISSDLSHYLGYEAARSVDRATVGAMLAGRTDIDHHAACGATPVVGLLEAARSRGLVPELLDLRNSGDTAGDRDRVVGYAAIAFWQPGRAAYDETHGDSLVSIARAAISSAFGADVAAIPEAPWLAEHRASFVTLTRDGDLRGCIGTLEAWRPLGEDVASNARGAAPSRSAFPTGDARRTRVDSYRRLVAFQSVAAGLRRPRRPRRATSTRPRWSAARERRPSRHLPSPGLGEPAGSGRVSRPPQGEGGIVRLDTVPSLPGLALPGLEVVRARCPTRPGIRRRTSRAPAQGRRRSDMTTNFPARWWHEIEDGRLQCDLCPRDCQLQDGQRGACFVRKREGDRMVLTTYGRSSGFCVDPIEKKPLHHFYPGSSVLSFGTAGCNLACKFCQNWDISKSREMDTLMDQATPETIARTARQLRCRSVAFTYNDPVIFAEYAMDVADACHAVGVQTVAVTAGYIHQDPRREFFAKMDAANVDLKAFTEEFYFKLTGAHLQPVLQTLVYLARETKVWLELTTLLIPGRNDSPEEIEAMTRWIVKELGPDVPLHFTAFHPDYRMTDTPATPVTTLERSRTIARTNGLRHVYTGNVVHLEGGTTFCPGCEAEVIVRDWHRISRYRLDDTGHCLDCGAAIPGRFGAFENAMDGRRMPVRLARANA